MQSAGTSFSKINSPIKKPLTRTSICPCGEPVLYESIQPGTVYTLDMATLTGGFFYRCGKCRTVQENVQCVKASQQLNHKLPMSWLPYGLFEAKR